MDDGKEITIPEQKGVEQERIEDVKRRILKAALERVTASSAAQSFEYYTNRDHKTGEKIYKGDINVATLSLARPNISPEFEGLSIALLQQSPRAPGELRRTLSYGLARALGGAHDTGKEVAVTYMKRITGEEESAQIIRLHFADIVDGLRQGNTMNNAESWTEPIDPKRKEIKPTLFKRWQNGALQTAETAHIGYFNSEVRNTPVTEADYNSVLSLIQEGVADKALTGKTIQYEVENREAKSVSGEEPPKGNRIIDAVRKRVPLLRLK